MEFDVKELIKSPTNYSGGKYKLLPQILPIFPNNINTFVDLFAGGCNVGSNIEADKIILNDISSETIEMFDYFANNEVDSILQKIHKRINEYQLSKTNEEGFLSLRNHYNQNKNPIDLYVLSCFSFNYRIRFNNKNEFNERFGRNRSSFSKTLERRLVDFLVKIKSKNVEYCAVDFRDYNYYTLGEDDLVYCDPPYLITDTAYNKLWNEQTEKDLLLKLDQLNEQGVKFALSNVLENKGKQNSILIEWSKKYIIHDLNFSYDKYYYSTNSQNKNKPTREVLVTNYTIY